MKLIAAFDPASAPSFGLSVNPPAVSAVYTVTPANTKVKAGGMFCYSGKIEITITSVVMGVYVWAGSLKAVINGSAAKTKIQGQPAVLTGDVSAALSVTGVSGNNSALITFTLSVTNALQNKITGN